MALELRGGSGLYYYRKKRVGDRVISEYVGSGIGAIFAESSALEDRIESRNKRRREAEDEREMKALVGQINDFCDEVEAEYRKAMEAAGFHRHKRGEWRKRRIK